MFFYIETIPWSIISNLKDEWNLNQSHCRILNCLVITWRRLFLVFISLLRLELQCTVRRRCTRRQRRRNFVYFFHCNHDSAIRNSISCWSHFMISAASCICTFPWHSSCGLRIYRWFSSLLAHVIQTWNDCRYSGEEDDSNDSGSAPRKPSSIVVVSRGVIIVVVLAVYTLSTDACGGSKALTIQIAPVDIWRVLFEWSGFWGRTWEPWPCGYAFPRVTVTFIPMWAINVTSAPSAANWSRNTIKTTANLPLTTLRIFAASWMNTASEADQGQTKRRRPNMHQLFIEIENNSQSHRTTSHVAEIKQRITKQLFVCSSSTS